MLQVSIAQQQRQQQCQQRQQRQCQRQQQRQQQQQQAAAPPHLKKVFPICNWISGAPKFAFTVQMVNNNHENQTTIIKIHLPLTKSPPFRRQQFQVNCHEWKVLYFD